MLEDEHGFHKMSKGYKKAIAIKQPDGCVTVWRKSFQHKGLVSFRLFNSPPLNGRRGLSPAWLCAHGGTRVCVWAAGEKKGKKSISNLVCIIDSLHLSLFDSPRLCLQLTGPPPPLFSCLEASPPQARCWRLSTSQEDEESRIGVSTHAYYPCTAKSISQH